MRKLVYYVGVSLDGYIAGPGGEWEFMLSDEMTAWITERYPDTVPTHIRPHLGLEGAANRAFDTVLMGRGTYQPGIDAGVTSPYSHLRQYVVSTTLGEIADPAVELVTGDPVALVRELKAQEGMDVWLAGGGKLAGTLLPEIDELVIKRYPVIAGSGIPAFDGPFLPTPFTPTRTDSLDNGASVTWFSRTPAA
ncbi:dihydrofolate reductase family protein [Rhodococcus sp. NPDC055112]